MTASLLIEKSESCWILLTWLSVRADELATAIFIVILRCMEVPVRPSYSHGKAASEILTFHHPPPRCFGISMLWRICFSIPPPFIPYVINGVADATFGSEKHERDLTLCPSRVRC